MSLTGYNEATRTTMKPKQLRAWMQKHQILGTLTVALYLGFRYAWKKRTVFLTVLLLVSLGMNACLLSLRRPPQTMRVVAPQSIATASVPPSASELVLDSDGTHVLHLPIYGCGYWFKWQRATREVDENAEERGDVLSVYDEADSRGKKPVYQKFFNS